MNTYAAEYLRALRIHVGLSLRDASAQSLISAVELGEIERAVREPTTDHVANLMVIYSNAMIQGLLKAKHQLAFVECRRCERHQLLYGIVGPRNFECQGCHELVSFNLGDIKCP